MTLADVKIFFRTVIKVVAGGPAVGTPGKNRAAGMLAALDKLADFVAELAGGPALDIYGISEAKRNQVLGLFINANQFKAVDVALTGDTSTGVGSVFGDFTNGNRYELLPDTSNPDSNGNATPTWLRT